jgi:hypothetical protein
MICPKFGANFTEKVLFLNIIKNTVWAIFWVIFSQKHLVALVSDLVF